MSDPTNPVDLTNEQLSSEIDALEGRQSAPAVTDGEPKDDQPPVTTTEPGGEDQGKDAGATGDEGKDAKGADEGKDDKASEEKKSKIQDNVKRLLKQRNAARGESESLKGEIESLRTKLAELEGKAPETEMKQDAPPKADDAPAQQDSEEIRKAKEEDRQEWEKLSKQYPDLSKYQAEVEEVMAAHPTMSYTMACRAIFPEMFAKGSSTNPEARKDDLGGSTPDLRSEPKPESMSTDDLEKRLRAEISSGNFSL